MSKGSGRRPQEADDKHVSSEWDRLFNKAVDKSIKDTFGNEDVVIETYGNNEFKKLKKNTYG